MFARDKYSGRARVPGDRAPDRGFGFHFQTFFFSRHSFPSKKGLMSACVPVGMWVCLCLRIVFVAPQDEPVANLSDSGALDTSRIGRLGRFVREEQNIFCFCVTPSSVYLSLVRPGFVFMLLLCNRCQDGRDSSDHWLHSRRIVLRRDKANPEPLNGPT